MRSFRSGSRDRARELRRGQTDAERLLWARLRGRQVLNAKFRRQHPVAGYIVDFCDLEHGLVVELDGGQHAEATEADQKRTGELQRGGFRVLRFWNTEVLLQTEAVLERIAETLKQPPHPNPLPGGEREG